VNQRVRECGQAILPCDGNEDSFRVTVAYDCGHEARGRTLAQPLHAAAILPPAAPPCGADLCRKPARALSPATPTSAPCEGWANPLPAARYEEAPVALASGASH